jgi:hypothetical protein
MNHLERSQVEPLDAFTGAAEPPERRINLSLTEERQAQICLSCPLPDCIGIESRECPIQIEQRAEWRRQHQARKVSQ